MSKRRFVVTAFMRSRFSDRMNAVTTNGEETSHVQGR